GRACKSSARDKRVLRPGAAKMRTGALCIVPLRLRVILPETDLVAVWIFKRAEHASAFVHGRTRAHALGSQIVQRSLDVLHAQAETRVAISVKGVLGGGRHEFKQNAVNIKASHNIP